MSSIPVAALAAALSFAASATSAVAADKACDQGRYSAADKMWLTSAAQGDHFEVAFGRLALERGNASVKELGSHLVSDHGNAIKKAEKIARDLKITLKDKPTPSQAWELDMLTKPGTDFDAASARLGVADHTQDIEETQEAAKSGCNAEVRKLAQDTLPVLKQHLELAKKAERSNSAAR